MAKRKNNAVDTMLETNRRSDRTDNGAGKLSSDTNASCASPATSGNPDGGNCSSEINIPSAAAGIAGQIRELYIARRAAQRDLFALNNSQRAMARRSLNFQWDADEKTRKAINDRAAEIVAAIEAGEIPAGVPLFVLDAVLASHQAKTVFQQRIAELDKKISKLVKSLPVWARIQANRERWRGVAETTIGNIIGEAGDLSNYPNPAKLRKRMGLAPFNGHAPATWRAGKVGKLNADEWVAIGYSPSRRSIMYVAGDCMMKAGGYFKGIYDAEKARQESLHPDMSKMQKHLRAKRKMESQLLIDLWVAWNGGGDKYRRETNALPTSPAVPAALQPAA